MMTGTEVLGGLDRLLGGRVAEAIVFGRGRHSGPRRPLTLNLRSTRRGWQSRTSVSFDGMTHGSWVDRVERAQKLPGIATAVTHLATDIAARLRRSRDENGCA